MTEQVGPLQQREEDLTRNRENKGRLAHVQQQYSSTGWGTLEFEDRLDFGLGFVQKPWPAYGCEIDPDLVRDILEEAGVELDNDDPVPLPQCTGYVTEWDVDDRGLYTGCWVAITVLFPDDIPTTGVDVPITHYFSFAAVAIKSVPMDALD